MKERNRIVRDACEEVLVRIHKSNNKEYERERAPLSLSLSLSHTHTHIYIYIYINTRAILQGEEISHFIGGRDTLTHTHSIRTTRHALGTFTWTSTMPWPPLQNLHRSLRIHTPKDSASELVVSVVHPRRLVQICRRDRVRAEQRVCVLLV